MTLTNPPVSRQVLRLNKEVAVTDTSMETIGRFEKSSLTTDKYKVGKQIIALSTGTDNVEGAYIDVTVDPTVILDTGAPLTSVYSYTLVARGIESDNKTIPPTLTDTALQKRHAGGQAVAIVVSAEIFEDLLAQTQTAVDDNLAAMQALLDAFEADITQQQTDFEADINQQWDDWQALNDPAELEVVNQKPVVTTTETEFSGGVRNFDFSKTGDIAATSVVGEIGDSGWYNENTTDLTCSLTKGVMKLESASAGEFFGHTPNKFTTLDSTDKKFLIPAVAGSDYRFSTNCKISALASSDCKFYLRFLDEDLATLQTTNISYDAVNNLFETKTAEVTAPANSVYCFVAAELNSALTIEIDSIKLEKVIEFDITGQENVSSARIGLEATSRDVVGQEQSATDAEAILGTTGSSKLDQSFTADKVNFASVKFERGTGLGTYTGNVTITIKDLSDNVIGRKVIANATWQTYTEETVEIPCLLVIGTQYRVEFSSSSTDAANYTALKIQQGSDLLSGEALRYWNGVSWVAKNYDLKFATLYSYKTNAFDVALHNEKIKLRAENGGLLNGAVLDLENGKYRYDSGDMRTLPNAISFSNNIYSAITGDIISTTTTLIKSYSYDANVGIVSGSTATEKELVLKVDTIFPCNRARIKRITTRLGTRDCSIYVSEDGVNYTLIETDTSFETAVIEAENVVNINNKSVFYIKIGAAASKNLFLRTISIEADIDTSSVKNLYSTPKDRVMYETISSVLPSACVRAYRRDSKFGFPAIEFTGVSGNYIGHEFLAFDFTGMALYFDQQTVADDAYITITSTENPEVDVHGTLTSNRLLVASNPDEDGSMQGKVIYSSVNQGLIYEVRDAKKEINKVKKGLEESNSETAENTTNTATNTANIATNAGNIVTNAADILALESAPFDLNCPFPLRSGTPLLEIIPYATPVEVPSGKQWILTSPPLDADNGNVDIVVTSSSGVGDASARLYESRNGDANYYHSNVFRWNNLILGATDTIRTYNASPTDIPATVLEFDENTDIEPISKYLDSGTTEYVVPANKVLVVLFAQMYSGTANGGSQLELENSAGTKSGFVRVDKPIMLPEGAKINYGSLYTTFHGYLVPDTLIF